MDWEEARAAENYERKKREEEADSEVSSYYSLYY